MDPGQYDEFANLFYNKNYDYPVSSPGSDFSSSQSSTSLMSPISNSNVRSPPAQRVPHMDSYISNNHGVFGTCMINSSDCLGIPYLEITEEPADMFRFRYKSEMCGTHGSIPGRSRKKTYPTVKLVNYPYEAIIQCTLVQALPGVGHHPHRLVVWQDNEDIDDPHHVKVGPSVGYSASFQGMSILYTGRRQIVEQLIKKYIQTPGHDGDISGSALRKKFESEVQNINLNSVRLCFMATDLKGTPICEQVFSKTIDNSKSAETCQLKITNISTVNGSCLGGEKVFIFVEKVNKKNIKIRFFEIDPVTKERIWETFADFTELDVHHQYGIVFKTPEYKNTNISVDVNVFIELYRPKDKAISDPISFHYKAEPRHIKRRRRADLLDQNEFYDTQVPLTVQNYQNSSIYPEVGLPPQENSIFYPTNVKLHHNIQNRHSLENISATELFNPPIGFDYMQLNCEVDSPGKSKQSNSKAVKETNDTSNSTKDNYKNYSPKERAVLSDIIKSIKSEKLSDDDRKRISLLLEYGLNNHENFLHMCISTNQLDAMKILLNYMKSNDCIHTIDQANLQGETPLHRAVNCINEDAVKILLSAGCNPNNYDHNGNLALHLCVLKNSFECMTHLLEYNKNSRNPRPFNVNHFNNNGMTPLHLAVKQGLICFVTDLIKSGADVDAKCQSDGQTVLHIAVECAHLPIISYLLNSTNINVNSVTHGGHTALHKACVLKKAKNCVIAELLLSRGADPKIKCNNLSANDLARESENYELIEVMKKQFSQESDDDSDSRLILDDNDLQIKPDPDDLDVMCEKSNVKTEDELSKFLDENTLNTISKMLDLSGKWREVAIELDQRCLLPYCEVSESPSKMLINSIELEEDITMEDFHKALLKFGLQDVASVVKGILFNTSS